MKKGQKKQASLDDDDTEIEALKARINCDAPESGSQNIYDKSKSFENYPISKRTLLALTDAKLLIPTEIQAAAIPHALAGESAL